MGVGKRTCSHFFYGLRLIMHYELIFSSLFLLKKNAKMTSPSWDFFVFLQFKIFANQKVINL